ncbi:MAG: NYN domain-containing protein [Methanimicrococcus sp.]|nr:NYN domain-containing protein [Methanimicrococcus sp.]
MVLVSNNKDNKVMMFIDLRNILKSVDTIPFNLDLYTLAVQLVGQRELVAAYVFDSKMPFGSDDASKRYHDKLRYLGFRVIARESYDSVRQEQKEVDVAMACEMVVHALRGHYDVAIVVSGDRDFVPAIQHIQAAGKKVEVAAFSNSVGAVVRQSADKFHELEKMPLLIMSNPRGESDRLSETEEWL